MKKVYITTNGCPRRDLDCSRLANYFNLNSYNLAPNPEAADFIIFLSCGFNKCREDKSFELIEKFRKFKGELIVSGCIPAINLKRLKEHFNGKYVPIENLNEIDRLFPSFETKLSKIPDTHIPYNQPANNKTKAYLRVASGCSQNCSYCGIKKAIGKLKSKPLNKCIKEYRSLIERGHKCMIFTADDIGSYGLDIGTSFETLLMELDRISLDKDITLEIQALNPVWLIKYKEVLFEMVKKGRISFILCPIQSGSEKILKLMNRYSNIDEIIKVLSELKRINPNIHLRTHVIIGFPSESQKDFDSTLSVIKNVGFNSVECFLFSDPADSPNFESLNMIGGKTILNRKEKLKDFLEKEKITLIISYE